MKMHLHLVTSLILLAGLESLPADDFSLRRFTLDGGGGTSAGGTFAVNGTVGQHDAGTVTGGGYALMGGFWGVSSVVSEPGAPALSIEALANGRVRLYWNLPAAGFQLEQAPAMTSVAASTTWAPVAGTPQTNANQISLIAPAAAEHRIFRLRKP